MPVPRVSVRKSVRNPISPRLGTMKSIRTTPRGVVGHLLHPALAGGHQLRDRADELVRAVNGHRLERFVQRTVDGAGHHLRLADGQLEAFAPHLLDEHGQRQLTPALHLPRVGPADVDDPDGHVADQFLVEDGCGPCGR